MLLGKITSSLVVKHVHLINVSQKYFNQHIALSTYIVIRTNVLYFVLHF